jgi:hypothetical protein
MPHARLVGSKARHQFAPDKQNQTERKFKLQIRTVSRLKVGI